MPYRHLLFDNDGTLMDFAKAQETAFRTAYTALFQTPCYNVQLLASYSRCNQDWWNKLEKGTCTKAELQLGRFVSFFAEQGLVGDVAAMNAHYVAALKNQCPLLPNTLVLLKMLYPHYQMHIITNGLSNVQHSRIEGSPLMPFIQNLFVSEDTGFAKPAAAYFDYVLNKLGTSHKDQCLVIGDSLSADILGAKNAGIDAVWFNPQGLPNPTNLPMVGEITSILHLPALLAKPAYP